MAENLSDFEQNLLITGSLAARQGSYSPYSNFRVGAVLLAGHCTPSDKESVQKNLVLGANIESASYGGTICAERTAIVKAVSDGKRSFIGLAVSSDVDAPISPCGICRQVLREFCSLDMPVFLVPSNYDNSLPRIELAKLSPEDRAKVMRSLHEEMVKGRVLQTTMGELLPMSFGPDDLLNK